jgi:hypothetical protein
LNSYRIETNDLITQHLDIARKMKAQWLAQKQNRQ